MTNSIFVTKDSGRSSERSGDPLRGESAHVNLLHLVGATQRSGGFTLASGNVGGEAPRQGWPRF